MFLWIPVFTLSEAQYILYCSHDFSYLDYELFKGKGSVLFL